MKLLKTIIDQLGFVDSKQLITLADIFPKMELIIRWGVLPREKALACNVAERIKEVEDSGVDYVRDVFIQSEHMQQIRTVMGEKSPY
jgi:hypothetical protein